MILPLLPPFHTEMVCLFTTDSKKIKIDLEKYDYCKNVHLRMSWNGLLYIDPIQYGLLLISYHSQVSCHKCDSRRQETLKL